MFKFVRGLAFSKRTVAVVVVAVVVVSEPQKVMIMLPKKSLKV